MLDSGQDIAVPSQGNVPDYGVVPLVCKVLIYFVCLDRPSKLCSFGEVTVARGGVYSQGKLLSKTHTGMQLPNWELKPKMGDHLFVYIKLTSRKVCNLKIKSFVNKFTPIVFLFVRVFLLSLPS